MRRWYRKRSMTERGQKPIPLYGRYVQQNSACAGACDAHGCKYMRHCFLQDKNTPEPQQGRTYPPLYRAVKQRNFELVVQMLQQGIDPNDPAEGTPLVMGAQRSGLRSPLHFSSIYQALDIAKALLSNQNGPPAAVDQVDAQGHTALYYVALTGNVLLGKLLLEHGADITKRFWQGNGDELAGETVIEFARRHRQHAFADSLLDYIRMLEDR